MILVVGATGQLGTDIVRELLAVDSDREVRAAAPDVEGRTFDRGREAPSA